MEEKSPSTIYEKLQTIDRRILYVILLLVISIPILYPMTVPNVPLPMSKDMFETINNTPNDKIILLNSDWTKGTRGENQPQTAAILHHLFAKKIKFAYSSFSIDAYQVFENLLKDIADEYGAVYGKDYISIGFQPVPITFIKALNVDFVKDRVDAKLKKPLDSYPIMQGIKNSSNIHMVIEISASAMHGYWIQLLNQNTSFGFCPTSVMAPESLTYYQSGQIKGVLWGAKGAYDYEQLSIESGFGKYTLGKRYMAPLSAAFLLVILSIVIGNAAMFAARRRRSGAQQ